MYNYTGMEYVHKDLHKGNWWSWYTKKKGGYSKKYTQGKDTVVKIHTGENWLDVDRQKRGFVEIHTGKGYSCKDTHKGTNLKLTHKRWVNINKIAHIQIYTEHVKFICGK